MTFHNIRFPVNISLNAEGGPMRRTEIVALTSGHEERNSPWAGSRRRFEAGYGVTSLADTEEIIAFFEARHGRLHAFRWRDPFDWKSCSISDTPQADDQILGTGDGTAASFQLTKTYVSGAEAYSRTITKPVDGTVLVALDGLLQIAGIDYTIDPLTGLVNFSAPPAAGLVVTAGFEFDVPVRFDTDQLSINLPALNAGDIPNIPVIEVLS